MRELNTNEALVVIYQIENDIEKFTVLYKDSDGHPDYAGREIKWLLNTFPKEYKFDIQCIVAELKLHGYNDDFDVLDLNINEDELEELDKSKKYPYKYVYVININKTSDGCDVHYECKRIADINFPDLSNISSIENFNSEDFKLN